MDSTKRTAQQQRVSRSFRQHCVLTTIGILLRTCAYDPAAPWSTRLRKFFEGVKTGTLRAGIATGSLVLGFRPIRALRSRTLKVPNPRISTEFPCASSSVMEDNRTSTTELHSVLEIFDPISRDTLVTRSDLVIWFLVLLLLL